MCFAHKSTEVLNQFWCCDGQRCGFAEMLNGRAEFSQFDFDERKIVERGNIGRLTFDYLEKMLFS